MNSWKIVWLSIEDHSPDIVNSIISWKIDLVYADDTIAIESSVSWLAKRIRNAHVGGTDERIIRINQVLRIMLKYLIDKKLISSDHENNKIDSVVAWACVFDCSESEDIGSGETVDCQIYT